MHHIFYHSWKSEMMMLWRSTTVIINNVVYCLRCIVQVHVVNQNHLMFIYYLYLIINDIYTWWEPWLVAFENRLMNSIQKKSRDHKSCDLKNNNDIRPKTSNRSSRRRQTFGGDASSCLRDHQRNTNDPKRSLTKAIRSWNIWMCTMKKLQAIKYKSWTDMGHWMLEK